MSKISKQLKCILGLGLVVLLAACGGTGNGDTEVPLSITVEADQTVIEASQDVTFTATIDGTGATADQVNWSAGDNSGDFSEITGLEVTWTAPADEGTYTISAELTVDGESDSDEVDITVVDSFGSLNV